MAEPNSNKRKSKIIIALIVFFLILTAGAYGFGVYYFSNHFLPGSVVNNFNCSYMTANEAEDLLVRKVDAYMLAVETRNNGVESIGAQQVGLKYVSDGSIRRILNAQNRFKWFLAFNQSNTYDLPVLTQIDQTALDNAVNGLACMQPDGMIPPADAVIVETVEGFAVAPENLGTTLNSDLVHQAVSAAMSVQQPVLNLEENGCYVDPVIRQNDEQIQKECNQMNDMTKAYITYDFGDRSELVERGLIKTWLVKDANGDMQLDETKVAEYVNSLGYKYDTFGCTRKFLTAYNYEISIGGGDYGWAIDQKAETAALIEAVKNGVVDVREPIYSFRGMCRDTNDIGYSYVEVDLANQMMFLYVDGNLIVETEVVTGNPNIPGNETPTGVYAIDAMKSPAVLAGENYQSDVTYWMPFNGNVGIHDADWREEFGGTIYLEEGSHGCVNTPYDCAEIIYHNVTIGTPVVVY